MAKMIRSVTNMPMTFRTLGGFALAMLTTASAVAQLMPTAAPPLPGEEIYSAVDPDGYITQESVPAGTVIQGEETGYKTLSSVFTDGSPLTDNLALHTNYPATLESTGTWLRRGLWYADLDAVVMTRTWDNDGRRLVFESNSGIEQLRTRDRKLGESSPDADGSARLALGRFLFRDQKNRDHTAEMIVLGGAEWVDRGAITAAGNGTLQVPQELTKGGTLSSFDLANDMSYTYSSHFNSFEWNYNVTQRMRKDQMQLGPDGEWTRRAASGWTQSYLAGLRYFELQEDFDWLAEGLVQIDAGTSGEMNIRSSNNMFGVQFGHGLTYETDRWNISLFSKHGMYVNDARSTSNLNFNDLPVGSTIDGFANEGHENSLSYLLQAGVTARYHLRPNVSLRVGYELLYVTSMALAPNEISFDGQMHLAGVSGDVFYRGYTFGAEYFW